MSREAVLQERHFKDYLKRHCVSWFHFALEKGILVEFGDIMLITECSKTMSWASAVYSQSSVEFALSFSAGGSFLLATPSLAFSAAYERVGSVQCRRSPRRAIMPLEGAPNDQTIFIKAYRPGPRVLYPKSFTHKIARFTSYFSGAGREEGFDPDETTSCGSMSESDFTTSVSPELPVSVRSWVALNPEDRERGG